MININDLTLGQIKELQQLFLAQIPSSMVNTATHPMIDSYVIIRTYSAGVWCGYLDKKDGNEVILRDARRMWKWWAAESISLSAVARYGIIQEKSKIVEAVPSVWLEAIEIIPCLDAAKKSLMGAPNVKAE